MEILFKNSFEKTEEWTKELNRFVFFRRPIILSVHLICLLALCWGIFLVLFLRIINIVFLFCPAWWFLLCISLYIFTTRITLKRNKEMYKNRVQVVSEVAKDSIKQIHSNGLQLNIYYDTIKKGYITQNYILLLTKSKMLYTFKRDGFSVGNQEDFLLFLRNKGIKVKQQNIIN